MNPSENIMSELNILVVEDDDFQRRMLVKMLHSLKVLSVSEASDGRQAIEMIRGEKNKPVDIVICDLNMPTMDGLEFIRHLGEKKHNIAIIIASALSSKLLASTGKMAQLYGIKLLGVVEKPITLAKLQTLLAKFERTQNSLQQAVANTSFTLEKILQGIQNRQFEPYFQPIVNLKNGQLVGAEAMVRWKHPEQGVILPAAFVPQLEQSGNIDKLTFLMLEKSATACRLFQDKGHKLIFSVNLSLVSLDDTALADKITQLVRKAGIEPLSIVLEITASAAMTEDAHALENLARLSINGFPLSIDDYGAGFSSLHQLTLIAFSELKVDQYFVRNFADNEALRFVIEASIAMAHKLQLKCVADGVESQQVWDALKEVGCDMAQGDFIAPPMDIRSFYNFVVDQDNKATNSAAIPYQYYSQLKILVVDDDDFLRKFILDALSMLGYANIVDANSAQSALEHRVGNAIRI